MLLVSGANLFPSYLNLQQALAYLFDLSNEYFFLFIDKTIMRHPSVNLPIGLIISCVGFSNDVPQSWVHKVDTHLSEVLLISVILVCLMSDYLMVLISQMVT